MRSPACMLENLKRSNGEKAKEEANQSNITAEIKCLIKVQ